MKNYTNLTGSGESEDDLHCPSLTYTQRVIGFGACMGMGGVLSVLSWIVLFQSNYVMFGVLNTIANLIALGSSLFLAGPKKQIQKMFDKTRVVATIIVFLMMILTFVAALALKLAWLTIIFCVLQYLALIWYGLSYIPYARDIIIKMVTGVCSSVAK